MYLIDRGYNFVLADLICNKNKINTLFLKEFLDN